MALRANPEHARTQPGKQASGRQFAAGKTRVERRRAYVLPREELLTSERRHLKEQEVSQPSDTVEWRTANEL